MKVGILSYPMLFQNDGGLQVQIRETIKHLKEIGIDISLVDPLRSSLADFDVIHVFSVIHGNDKIVGMAKEKGCRVILSPILNPSLVPSSGWPLKTVHFLDKLVGKLSQWTVHTNYHSIKKALQKADHLIALSNSECSILVNIYGVDKERISIVPNGVSAHFFQATENLFLTQYKISRPFVFCPALISSWKNQKTLIEALAGTGIEIVLAGPVLEKEKKYYEECLAPHNKHVNYIGVLERESAIFSSGYAAASATVLPSKGESGPLVALESLAAGTPALITEKNGLTLTPDNKCLTAINPFDPQNIKESVQRVISNRPLRDECQRLVKELSWSHIATCLAAIYSSSSL